MTSDTLREQFISRIGTESFEFYEAAFDGCWIWDMQELGESWTSPKFCATFGYDSELIPHGSKFWRSISHPDDWDGAMEAVEVALTSKNKKYSCVIRMRHRNGNWVSVELRGVVCAEYAYGVQIDKTEELERQNKLEALSRLDPLTGLLNRRGLEESIPRALANSDRYNLNAYAAFIDLDDFKRINTGWGQAMGDLVLRKMGDRMKRMLRITDDCGRVGGDEFLAIVTCRDSTEALRVMNRLREGMSQPIELNGSGDVVEITCSSAVVPLCSSGDSACSTLDAVLEKASPLLLDAKTVEYKNTTVNGGSAFPPALSS